MMYEEVQTLIRAQGDSPVEAQPKFAKICYRVRRDKHERSKQALGPVFSLQHVQRKSRISLELNRRGR